MILLLGWVFQEHPNSGDGGKYCAMQSLRLSGTACVVTSLKLCDPKSLFRIVYPVTCVARAVSQHVEN